MHVKHVRSEQPFPVEEHFSRKWLNEFKQFLQCRLHVVWHYDMGKCYVLENMGSLF